MRIISAAFALFILVCSSAHAGFYDHKTLTIVTNYASGGGPDIEVRLFVHHLRKYLPTTTVVVLPKPGGGGNIGPNHFAANPSTDGLSVGYMSGILLNHLIDPSGLKVNPKAFNYVATVGNGHIYVVSTKVAASLKDLVTSGIEITVGALGPREARDLRAMLAMDLLGVRYRLIIYRGDAAAQSALSSGEIDAAPVGVTHYIGSFRQDRVDTGLFVPLWVQSGDAPIHSNSGQVADVWTAHYRVHGRYPSGPAWEAFKALEDMGRSLARTIFLPAGVPDAAIDELAAATSSVYADAEFQRDTIARAGYMPRCHCGRIEANDAVRRNATLRPDVQRYIAAYLNRPAR